MSAYPWSPYRPAAVPGSRSPVRNGLSARSPERVPPRVSGPGSAFGSGTAQPFPPRLPFPDLPPPTFPSPTAAESTASGWAVPGWRRRRYAPAVPSPAAGRWPAAGRSETAPRPPPLRGGDLSRPRNADAAVGVRRGPRRSRSKASVHRDRIDAVTVTSGSWSSASWEQPELTVFARRRPRVRPPRPVWIANMAASAGGAPSAPASPRWLRTRADTGPDRTAGHPPARLRQRQFHPARQLGQGCLGTDILGHHHELVPAQPGCGVPGPHTALIRSAVVTSRCHRSRAPGCR
jgi:hypothetical protein